MKKAELLESLRITDNMMKDSFACLLDAQDEWSKNGEIPNIGACACTFDGKPEVVEIPAEFTQRGVTAGKQRSLLNYLRRLAPNYVAIYMFGPGRDGDKNVPDDIRVADAPHDGRLYYVLTMVSSRRLIALKGIPTNDTREIDWQLVGDKNFSALQAACPDSQLKEELKGAQCPQCATVMLGAFRADGTKAPIDEDAGVIAVCGACGAILIVDREHKTLRLIDAEYIRQNFTPDLLAKLPEVFNAHTEIVTRNVQRMGGVQYPGARN